MTQGYDYLVEIAGWTGWSYIAGRPLAFEGNGYDDLLVEVGDIVQSIEPSRKSSCRLTLSNRPYGPDQTRLSDEFATTKIEGKTVTVRELFRDSTTARTLFKGVVRSRSYDANQVTLELIESSLNRSKRLDVIVEASTFARAKPADIGKSVPVIFNDPSDVVCPVVASNAHSRLAAEIDSSSTADIALDSVENFPSSGTVRIGREKISYTSLDTANNELSGTITRAASSTTAAAHIQGSLVIVVDEFDLGIDAVQTGTTVTKAEAVDSERRRYPLADPDSHENEDGIRKARWNETPTYFEPAGELEAHVIELDTDGASNANFPEKALGRSSSYTDSNYCEVQKYSGSHEAFIGFSGTEHPSRGNIKKVLLQVVHSGNNAQLVVDTGKSVLGTGFEVKCETQTGSPRVLVGNLSPTDQLDEDFLEIAERKGSRATQVGSASTSVEGVVIQPDGVAESAGLSSFSVQTGAKEDQIDGDYGSSCSIGPGGGAAGGKFTFSISSLPPGISSGAKLDKVTFKWRHGGSGETGNGEYEISLERSASTVDGPDTITKNTSSTVDEVVSYQPPSDTIADLTSYTGIIDPQSTPTQSGFWDSFECWFEIDYTDADADQGTGSVTNHFDATGTLDTWAKVSNGLADIRATVSSTGIRLYHAGFIVIYEPTIERVPDRIALSLDGGITGTPAAVIDDLWQTRAGNSAGSISSSDVTALGTALTSAGYTAAAVAGAIRAEGLWDTVQRLARECRFRAYIENDVLRMAYIELISAGSATARIDAQDLAELPEVMGADIERQVMNKVRLKYNFSEIEGHRSSLEDSDSSSISAYGEFVEERELQYVLGDTAATATKDMILDRFDEPWDELEFEVTLALRNTLALLSIVELAFDWFTASRFEIEELSETGEHTIKARGRVLG